MVPGYLSVRLSAPAGKVGERAGPGARCRDPMSSTSATVRQVRGRSRGQGAACPPGGGRAA